MQFFRSILISTLLSLLFATVAQSAETLELSWRYQLRAQRPYETGLTPFTRGAVGPGRLKLRQVGAYCDIVVERVDVLPLHASDVRRAPSLGQGRYDLPQAVSRVNVLFRQETWDNVGCDLEIYVEQDGGACTYTCDTGAAYCAVGPASRCNSEQIAELFVEKNGFFPRCLGRIDFDAGSTCR